MKTAQWTAHRTGEREARSELEVHYHDGEPDWDGNNWKSTFMVRQDTEREMVVAERHTWEYTEITWPSGEGPETIRRIRREVLGEAPDGDGAADALFGSAIVPHLPGRWITADQLEADDLLLEWSRFTDGPCPQSVVAVDRDQETIVLDLILSGGARIANPRRTPAGRWVQIQRLGEEE